MYQECANLAKRSAKSAKLVLIYAESVLFLDSITMQIASMPVQMDILEILRILTILFVDRVRRTARHVP